MVSYLFELTLKFELLILTKGFILSSVFRFDERLSWDSLTSSFSSIYSTFGSDGDNLSLGDS